MASMLIRLKDVWLAVSCFLIVLTVIGLMLSFVKIHTSSKMDHAWNAIKSQDTDLIPSINVIRYVEMVSSFTINVMMEILLMGMDAQLIVSSKMDGIAVLSVKNQSAHFQPQCKFLSRGL